MRPAASAHVPDPMTRSAPASSVRSIIGANVALTRVAVRSAVRATRCSSRERSSSDCSRFDVCTSTLLDRLSSATAASDPLRRRFSRDASLTSPEKRRAVSPHTGATTSDTRASRQSSQNRAQTKITIRTRAEMPSASPDSTKRSTAPVSPVRRDRTSPRLTVVEGERQPEQPGEQVSPEGREEALGEDGGRQVVGVRESRARAGSGPRTRARSRRRASDRAERARRRPAAGRGRSRPPGRRGRRRRAAGRP